jgi:protein STE50
LKPLRFTYASQVGLHIDGAHHLRESILNTPEIEITVTRAVNSIAFLLTEIEALRRRYELKPRLIPENPEDEKARRDSKPHSGLFRPAKHLQQRMRDNQKQKSFLALTKWAVCDAKRFDEKVKRLKNLIDGLEDISKAAGIIQFQSSPQNLTTTDVVPLNEDPPPYSVEAPLQQGESTPVVTSAVVDSSSAQDPELSEQYTSLKNYAASLWTNAPRRLRAREKLSRLLDRQFKELQVDVYDELCRRRQVATPPSFLPPVDTYHVKRNRARERLAVLPWYRFAHLVTDVVFEMERRFPLLEVGTESVLQPVIAPDTLTRTFSQRNRRHGAILPHDSPPPPLRERASHPASMNGTNFEISWPFPFHHSQTSTTLGQVGQPLENERHAIRAP